MNIIFLYLLHHLINKYIFHIAAFRRQWPPSSWLPKRLVRCCSQAGPGSSPTSVSPSRPDHPRFSSRRQLNAGSSKYSTASLTLPLSNSATCSLINRHLRVHRREAWPTAGERTWGQNRPYLKLGEPPVTPELQDGRSWRGAVREHWWDAARRRITTYFDKQLQRRKQVWIRLLRRGCCGGRRG